MIKPLVIAISLALTPLAALAANTSGFAAATKAANQNIAKD